MASLLSKLSQAEQRELLADMNYLNMGEIKTLCKKHDIPYVIWIEARDQGRRKTRDEDRKGVVLDRLRQHLKTGTIPAATCFPASVVCFDEPPAKIKVTDRLFYGQYDPKRNGMVPLLEKLTGENSSTERSRESSRGSSGAKESPRRTRNLRRRGYEPKRTTRDQIRNGLF
jgi:hypothetical protein